MRIVRSRRGYILLAVLAALALVGCKKGGSSAPVEPGAKWLDDMRARISEQIPDKDHATRLIALVDDMEVHVEAFDVEVVAFYEALGKLDRDYNARRADFETLIDQFSMKRMALRDGMIDVRFQMRKITTDEEWAIIADIDNALLESWQRAYEM